MKLKKIVSLALAGVMAVSMLAGCNFDGAASNGSSSSSEQTATTGVAAAMNAVQKNVVFKDSTSNDLANAVKKATYAQLKNASNYVTSAGMMNTTGDAVANQLFNEILPSKVTFQNTRTVYDFAQASKSAAAGDSMTIAYLYMVDDVVSEEVAATLVANAVATNSAYYPVVVHNSKNEASYTGEVSIQKVSKSDELGENTASAYYVLVTITQTVDSANVNVSSNA